MGIKEGQFPPSSLGLNTCSQKICQDIFLNPVTSVWNDLPLSNTIFSLQSKGKVPLSLPYSSGLVLRSLFQCVTIICRSLLLPLDCELLMSRDHISLTFITFVTFRKTPGTLQAWNKSLLNKSMN